MAILPLYGHQPLRQRLAARVQDGRLPQSILFHGPQGIGKQRLAIWVAQLLLCESAAPPCGSCRHCRYVLELSHPDLHWVFPRPRPKDSELAPEDVALDLATARRERAAAAGLYEPPPGEHAIYLAMVRYMVQQAGRAPALARRKVFVVGDAERMVQQEGSEYAANAFLKLLEEPPPDTWILVTSSHPQALLPTIRSRLVALRLAPLDSAALQAFLGDPAVKERLDSLGIPRGQEERLALCGGAPGRLLASGSDAALLEEARAMLGAAAAGQRSEMLKLAFLQGQRGARGAFAALLDALALVTHERARKAVLEGREAEASAAARALLQVEEARRLAEANVNPQLISAVLLHDMARALA
jgi:DNA polymerase-3 subunit delta'